MIREKKGVFEGIEENIELIGFINCGGCPAEKMKKIISKDLGDQIKTPDYTH